MTEADELKARVQADIDTIQQIQIHLMHAGNLIDEVRQNILLYSLTNENMYTRSAARTIAEVGGEIELDKERLMAAQSELHIWSIRL